jgi:hypothetical protein
VSNKASAAGAVVKERYALYYPYIHIRDVNWLKATLLWFQQVRRIVPEQFTLKDFKQVREFTETSGPAGPLLVEAHLFEEPVRQAKANLLKKIEDNLDGIVKRYARNQTPAGLADAFQVHRYKLLEGSEGKQLPDLLIENKLAWHSRTSADADLWLSMHPTLGAAVMSILALAIAENEGLDIITPDEHVHGALLAEREADVFSTLLDLPRTPSATSDDDLADDLAQLVLTTQFDYTMLTANDIKVLLDERKDLRRFRERVATIVSDIPGGIGPQERERRLKEKKKDILHEWDEQRSLLPKFAREALVETTAEETLKRLAEHLPELGSAAVAGTLTAHALGAAPGLALTVIAGAGAKMWRRRNSPFRFLNRVDKAVSKSWKGRAASLYLPQWSKLAHA